MKQPRKSKGSPRERLLARLDAFEQAIEPLHPNHRGPGDWKERAENLRAATEGLRLYLSEHLAPKELMEYRELPDSDAEIAAFAYELRMEHADLVRELGDVIATIRQLETSLDRHEDALQIYRRCRILAQRVARHAGSEEAELGRYT